MTQVPIRVLNQDTASVLAQVEEGATVEITRRGRAIARIVPIRTSVLEDLIVEGRALPATRRGPIPMPAGEIDTELDSTDIISEMREERL